MHLCKPVVFCQPFIKDYDDDDGFTVICLQLHISSLRKDEYPIQLTKLARTAIIQQGLALVNSVQGC